MLLTIDIGNTNIVIGIFQNDSLTYQHRFETQKHLKNSPWQYYFTEESKKSGIRPNDVEEIAIACVVPDLLSEMQSLCSNYFEVSSPYIISHQSDLHLKLDVEQPEKVGIDRLINAAAAYEKYKTDLIVVDMGTATTFDTVLTVRPSDSPTIRKADSRKVGKSESQTGVFIGGLITPGLHISSQALFEKASQLFEVPYTKPNQVIGKNTKDCLQSGMYYGYLGMIDSLVWRLEDELKKKMTVVATGGLSSLFSKDSKTIDHYEEHLTLLGMKLIYDWNS